MIDYNDYFDQLFSEASSRYLDIDDLDTVVELVTKDILTVLMPVMAEDVRSRYETLLSVARQAIIANPDILED